MVIRLVNDMKIARHRFIIKLIFACSGFLAVLFPVLVFVFTSSVPAAACTGAGMFVFLLLMAVLYRTDDHCITDIVVELSRLIDILSELEEKEIFPENEDSAVSKLQAKVIKLVRVLNKKNQQAAAEKENIKSLVSDFSHQLKTPISNLVMYSDFLNDDTLTEEKRREYISVFCQSVDRLRFLSENMIKLSRLESGLIQLDMQKQSINKTVLGAVKDVYPKAKAKNVEIVYSEEKNVFVNCDCNWTAEAVFNLLDNAVKYSAAGSKVFLSIKSYEIFAVIEVKDENPPLPEAERAQIFTRFYRGSKSKGKEGIGIGLYLAREIVVRQGGYMKLQCTKGGNVFSIVLQKQGLKSDIRAY